MKKLYFILLLLFSGLLFGQLKQVPQKVQNLIDSGKQTENYQLFTKNENTQKTLKYNTSVSDITILDISKAELKRINKEAPEFISVKVPFQNEEIEVQLYKQSILTETFYAKDESGNIIDYTPGEYYRGIVKGDNSSLAAVSFFEDNVMGVISVTDKGNIVVGKSADKEDYIAYSDWSLLGSSNFSCAADELDYNKQIQSQMEFNSVSSKDMNETENCVGLYYEIAYAPYQQNGYDVNATVDWISGIQNNVSAMYDDSGINIGISSIMVWTVNDPYTGDYGQMLYDFRDRNLEFDGDLGHLINYPMTTSVAFLDSLCTDYNHAYSGIDMTYEEVPVYSWTIMVMSHEMGHSMGSPHTHSCFWNGNNTAIDGCGPAAGYNDGCDGPIPPEGGTIMSYCHLVSAGINLNLGFGEQPGTQIRNTIDSKECLNDYCPPSISVCTHSLSKISTDYIENGLVEIELSDNTSTEWAYTVVPYGSPIPDPEDWEIIQNKVFTISGLTDYQYYDLRVTNICNNGIRGDVKRILLLPGDFCDGTLFTDTGGTSANYGNNEYFYKTFYPSVPGEKVSLNIQKINLENDKDFLYVHNGDTITAPYFSDGMITGYHNPGPVFTSTHTSGAITVEFSSDATQTRTGWEGLVNCSSLGINEFSDNNGLLVYPNPTTGILNIVSQKSKVERVQITDVSGRMVMNRQLNVNNEVLDISFLPAGVYMVIVEINGKTIGQKIIKR